MSREAPPQFPLDLPHDPRLGAEDFLVGPSNVAAQELVTSWPNWPDRILLLVGPEGAGKSHLASIWRETAGGASAIDVMDPLVAAGEIPLLLDDADRFADEIFVFHLINAVRERGGSLLITSRTAPTLLWPRLPDLASRLRALPVARLEHPDESAVKAVLVKLLDDRQLRVEAGVVEFVARRVTRSLGAIRAVVAELDRESLARGRAVGRGLAADVLARLNEENDP